MYKFFKKVFKGKNAISEEDSNYPQFSPISSDEVILKNEEFSAAAEHFIHTQPNFILKGMIYIIFLLLLSAFIYSFFAKVNVKVTTSVLVSGDDYVVQSPVFGSVGAVFVDEDDEISEYQKLLTLESETILQTESTVEQLENNMNELKEMYNQLSFTIKEINNLADFYAKQNNSVRINIAPEFYSAPSDLLSLSSETMVDPEKWGKSELFNYLEKTRVQISETWSEFLHFNKLLTNQEKIFNEDKRLYESEVITEYQYSATVEKYLSLQSTVNSVVNNFKIEIYSVLQGLIEQRKQVVDQYRSLQVQLDQTLVSEDNIVIDDKMVIVNSKYPGIVAEVNVNSYQFINRGMNIMTIIRSDLPMHGTMYISDSNIGKVKVGQSVTIKFDAFPFQEYGVQTGRIVSVSPDAKIIDGIGLMFEAKMVFDTINPKINLKYGMRGIAEIQTGTKRMIETIFAPITKVFDYLRGKQ